MGYDTDRNCGDATDVSVEDVRTSIESVQHADVHTVGDVIKALGTASFMPLILIVALIIVTPLSAIPGLTTLSGLTIALVAAQLLIGRTSMWLPNFVLRREISKVRLNQALSKIDKPLDILESHTEERFTVLARGLAVQLILVICIACGLFMPLLEFIPATSSLLGGTVALLVIAIITRDGFFALSGLVSFSLVLGIVSFLARSIYGLV